MQSLCMVSPIYVDKLNQNFNSTGTLNITKSPRLPKIYGGGPCWILNKINCELSNFKLNGF